MRPATCGSGARSAKAAPPLKSTSTKASWSGGWVAARPATTVRSSSLLPEPVAPTTSPCGPMPSSAASLRSSRTGSPRTVTPTGTLSSSDRGRGRTPSPGPSGRSRRSMRRTGPARGAVEGGGSSRRGAMRRARASQRGRPAVSVRMPLTRWPPGVVSRRVAKPSSSRRTRIEISDGSPAVASASQMTVTPPPRSVGAAPRPSPPRRAPTVRRSPAPPAKGRRPGPARFGRGSRRDADWRRRGHRSTARLRAGRRWWSGRGRGAARSSTPTRGGRWGDGSPRS